MSLEFEIKRAIDNYSSTVVFILALLHEYLFDPKLRARRTDALHEHGLAQTERQITPDIALIIPDPSVALVGEAKYDFARETQGRDKIRNQLLKYDDLMASWLTPPGRAGAGSVVLLVHYGRKGDVVDYFEEELRAKRFSPRANVAVVTAARVPQADTFIHLEKAFGTLEPAHIAQKMRPLAIREEHVLSGDFSTIKFYDAEPPLAYLLQVIWDHVLGDFVPESVYHETSNGDPILTKGQKRPR